MKRSLITAGVAGALLVLVGCETTGSSTSQPTTQASMGMLNDTCPLSGDPVDPNARTVSYAGHTIGFCCNGCVAGWNKKSANEKAAYVAGLTH